MIKRTETLQDDLFVQLIKKDKWVSEISSPVRCYDKYDNFKHFKTCSYPVEYIVSEEQVRAAKQVKEERRKDILSNIKEGELVFRAMGCDFESSFKDGVGNHSIRCEFKNSKGHRYLIELLKSIKHETFFVNFSIDRELEVQRKMEYWQAYEERKRLNQHFSIEDKQGYYRAFVISRKSINKPFTLQNVLSFMNKTFGCNYKSCRIIRYLVDYDEWCCNC